jgi:hypothetical protein
MNTSILALLQVTASLLLGIQGNTHVSAAAQQQVVTLADHVVQMSAQATADIPFSVTPNDSIYPSATDLVHSPYLDANGNYVQLGSGSTIQFEQGYISFGDLNGDGFDDAAVVVERMASGTAPTYALAALLNQGNMLFNIADYPLGSTMPTINSHEIISGVLVMNMQIGSSPAATSTYQLVGDQFLKVN